VQADNPVAYCKARVFLVQKAVSLEGYSSPMPIQTQSVAATIAFLKDLAHEGDDPRVNENGGEPHPKRPDRNKSETKRKTCYKSHAACKAD
jgi:hypothetical protein